MTYDFSFITICESKSKDVTLHYDKSPVHWSDPINGWCGSESIWRPFIVFFVLRLFTYWIFLWKHSHDFCTTSMSVHCRILCIKQTIYFRPLNSGWYFLRIYARSWTVPTESGCITHIADIVRQILLLLQFTLDVRSLFFTPYFCIWLNSRQQKRDYWRKDNLDQHFLLPAESRWGF